MEKFYLLIIQRSWKPIIATEENGRRILLFSNLDNAKNKAQEVLDSGDYRASRVDILPTKINREEDIHFEVFYKIEG
jgi:hypothetical protein